MAGEPLLACASLWLLCTAGGGLSATATVTRRAVLFPRSLRAPKGSLASGYPATWGHTWSRALRCAGEPRAPGAEEGLPRRLGCALVQWNDHIKPRLLPHNACDVALTGEILSQEYASWAD